LSHFIGIFYNDVLWTLYLTTGTFSGTKSVLAYATVNGHLIGWDLRSPDYAWVLKNDPKNGNSIYCSQIELIRRSAVLNLLQLLGWKQRCS